MFYLTSKEKIVFPLLLVLYILIIICFSQSKLTGDESRYYRYAVNITQGFYEAKDNPSLGNGPGYPLLIAPFIGLGIPLIYTKILNAFLLFFSLMFFKKTVDLYSKSKYTINFIIILGLYPPLLRWLPYMYSETFAFFSMCGLIFFLCKVFQKEKLELKYVLASTLFLGLLVIIKVIYLHVVLAAIFLIGIAILIWKNKRKPLKSAALILIGSVLVISPYLFYAYNLTGKLFYLGTAGGEILYHRSTPFENEFGNWFAIEDVIYGDEATYKADEAYTNLSQLSKNHKEKFVPLLNLTHIEQDSILKSMAIDNMINHPLKYVKNTVANIGRLFIHYPFSYRSQNLNMFGYMIPNSILLFVFSVLFFTNLYKKRLLNLPFAIKLTLIFALLYTSALIVLDGRGRNFIVIVPIVLLYIAYNLIVQYKLCSQNKNNE